uniref:Uncharacterized protein n=1 Tax=Haptolina ericina TaxID=156174 RepID=A0A7S3ASH0_9EUKA
MAEWAEEQIHVAVHESHQQLNSAQRQTQQAQQELKSAERALQATQHDLEATRQALQQSVMEAETLRRVARGSIAELEDQLVSAGAQFEHQLASAASQFQHQLASTVMQFEHQLLENQQLLEAERNATKDFARALYQTEARLQEAAEASQRTGLPSEQLAALEREKAQAVSQAWAEAVEVTSMRAAEQQQQARLRSLERLREQQLQAHNDAEKATEKLSQAHAAFERQLEAVREQERTETAAILERVRAEWAADLDRARTEAASATSVHAEALVALRTQMSEEKVDALRLQRQEQAEAVQTLRREKAEALRSQQASLIAITQAQLAGAQSSEREQSIELVREYALNQATTIKEDNRQEAFSTARVLESVLSIALESADAELRAAGEEIVKLSRHDSEATSHFEAAAQRTRAECASALEQMTAEHARAIAYAEQAKFDMELKHSAASTRMIAECQASMTAERELGAERLREANSLHEMVRGELAVADGSLDAVCKQLEKERQQSHHDQREAVLCAQAAVEASQAATVHKAVADALASSEARAALNTREAVRRALSERDAGGKAPGQ